MFLSTSGQLTIAASFMAVGSVSVLFPPVQLCRTPVLMLHRLAAPAETAVAAARAPKITPYGGGSYGVVPTSLLPATCYTAAGNAASAKGPDCFTFTSTTAPGEFTA